MKDNREAAIAAAVILVGFGIVAFLLPRIMLAVGEFSTLAAGMVAAAFVALFFLIFWARARWQRRRGREED
ncbi:hypothetical protein [Nitratireductor thuwali]|uniref:SoxR reducing system RseC family protein n=1 Tax=Nitratireductor thuwali TaxID=2267699 RepID=A0ABY5MI00_9HYPH|nr:hypothetical protein NTH_01294 [Nitratireductor thuwali]